MDETGPYLQTNCDSPVKLSTSPIAREHRVTLGPERPSSLKSDEELHEHRRKKEKAGSDKKQSRKHKSKEKSREKKKKRKEEYKSKHRK